ncbi:MAG: transcriptional regulator PpsR [Dongiaceae bacterium]
MKAFSSPQATIGALDADNAARLLAAAADIAVIIDRGGVVRDLAIHDDGLARELGAREQWPGRPWIDTVTVESRPKVEVLLRDAGRGDSPRWRQVNHPVAGRADVPVLYAVEPIGEDGRLVAFGRDLRSVSTLQQRLVEAQLAMERDYTRLRHVENRHRLLFEMSAEAVLIIDAQTHRVTDANPAARRLFGPAAKRALSQPFSELFHPESRNAVVGLLAGARLGGRSEEVRAALADPAREVSLAAASFRQDNQSLLLVRLTATAEPGAGASEPASRSRLLQLMENAPDGFVVTGPEGRILAANAAFLEMAQLATPEQALGESLERWLGRPGVDLNVLIANLRQRGAIRLFATTLRSEFGGTAEVEISAVALRNGGPPCLGFAIRNVDRRLSADGHPSAALPRSFENLTELIGRVPLKELVRETTDVIERLCIEAALELTGDNRASAAEMLGLSRQSLYIKLRRYGLSSGAAESEG